MMKTFVVVATLNSEFLFSPNYLHFIEEYGEHSKQFDQNLNKYSELKDHTRVFFCSFRIRI